MTPTARNLLKWELRWIPLEIGMTGLGLFLLQVAEAGAWFLFLAAATSGTVRVMHYWENRQATGVK